MQTLFWLVGSSFATMVSTVLHIYGGPPYGFGALQSIGTKTYRFYDDLDNLCLILLSARLIGEGSFVDDDATFLCTIIAWLLCLIFFIGSFSALYGLNLMTSYGHYSNELVRIAGKYC